MADIVKVLRQKCDELDDQLDEATEAKEAAVKEQEKLEAEVAELEGELEKERSAGDPEGQATAAGGADASDEFRSEVEQLQAALVSERSGREELQRESEALETATAELEEKADTTTTTTTSTTTTTTTNHDNDK